MQTSPATDMGSRLAESGIDPADDAACCAFLRRHWSRDDIAEYLTEAQNWARGIIQQQADWRDVA